MRMSSRTAKNLLSILQYALCLVVLLLAIYHSPRPLTSPANTVLLANTQEFNHFLMQYEATLGQVRLGSSALDFHPANLPWDLPHLPSGEKTSQFISLVLSPALQCREKILAERNRLILFALDVKRGKKISQRRRQWYRRLAARYRVPEATPEELLERVDIIPVSLTIAQAISESGWGTSRFAQQGNALYGQHLPRNSRGRYLLSRFGGVKVAAFDSVLQATASYMRTLNTSTAYESLRILRRQQRQEGKTIDGYTLAAGLLYYSEIGEDYITNIRYLIRKYQLDILDQATLNKKLPAVVVRFKHPATAPATVQAEKQEEPGGQLNSSS